MLIFIIHNLLEMSLCKILRYIIRDVLRHVLFLFMKGLIMSNFEETKAQIIDLVNKQIVPGASFGFIDGSQTDKFIYGNKSWVPEITPLKGDELHDLASLTKIMGTVPLILKMLDKKLIDLHDPIKKYLPEFSDDRVELFHLITHTSGIKGYIPNRDMLNCDELIHALEQLPVTDDFNKKVVYTDTGLIFLGLVIEKIYKMSVQDAIMKYIIEPEGLTDATFSPDINRCVPTYPVDGEMLIGIPNDPKARQLGSHCGSAGMFATLDDVLKFAQGMLSSDKKFLYHNFTTLNPGRSLGWDVKPDGSVHVLFHTGYTGEFIALDYKHQNAMVVMTNRVHPKQNNQLFLERRATILDSFLNESK